MSGSLLTPLSYCLPVCSHSSSDPSSFTCSQPPLPVRSTAHLVYSKFFIIYSLHYTLHNIYIWGLQWIQVYPTDILYNKIYVREIRLHPYAQNHHTCTGITIPAWDLILVWHFPPIPYAYSDENLIVDTYTNENLVVDT